MDRLSEDEQTVPANTPTKNNKPVEVNVHGLKAKFFLNCSEKDLIPSRFLKKAEETPTVQRTIWIFRGHEDGRNVKLNRWSQVDIRFRGVFKTLKKVPQFSKGLYEDKRGEYLKNYRVFNSRKASSAQGQVVYALLDEILSMVKIRRKKGAGEGSYFLFRPRLFQYRMSYCTGYGERYSDAPYCGGFVCIDQNPSRGVVRAILPVLTTEEESQPLVSAFQEEFKVLLGQLLLHIHRLHPPGDMIPDQEVFMIRLHGPRLHILRGIFPGHKTSRLWSGRHKALATDDEDKAKLFATADNERFYTKHNLDRLMQEVEWLNLSAASSEPNPRVFQVLASREYDLWLKKDFRDAVRLLVGLAMYLMSGKAKCGILQKVFATYPGDENSDEERPTMEKIAKQDREVVYKEVKMKEEEKKKREEHEERIWEREAMRSSADDSIRGLQAFRQPWWDWVWEDIDEDGIPKDDADVILEGP